MKYTQYTGKKKKRPQSFYIVTAVCLVIIGGAVWFATNNVKNAEIPQNETPKIDNEYQDKDSSYIEEEPQQDVSEEMENVPFEEEVETEPDPVPNYTMPVEGKILKDFNDKELQYSLTYFDMRLHTGVDIECKEGTPINAMGDGTVTAVEDSADYGRTIIVEHIGGITVKYCSFKNVDVARGDKVKMGDKLGTSAVIPCECKDNPHIHIEAYKDNKPVSVLEVFGLK